MLGDKDIAGPFTQDSQMRLAHCRKGAVFSQPVVIDITLGASRDLSEADRGAISIRIWNVLSSCSRDFRNAGISWRAHCPAENSRCSPWLAQ
jgi:hypothetical protein